MMKIIEFKTFSYSGKDKSNEDYILCRKVSENCLVVILADGMGGLSYGAEAARIVSESILTTILDKLQEHSPEEVLRMAFEAADSAIYEKCRELKCKMGAAVTAVLIKDDSLYYAWQGNVRLYRVADGNLSLLTTDHIINEAEGIFLTRCVNGKGYREDIPILRESVEHIDRIYICSDGCYQHLCLKDIINNYAISSADNIIDDCSLVQLNFE